MDIEKLISAISDWPVIIQGALGSALFATVLYGGQKVAAKANAKYSEVSRKRRKAFLLEQRLKYAYRLTKDNATRGAILVALWYRASRHLIRAAIWITLGLLGSKVVSVLDVIGYLGGLYYLFAALNTVSPSPEADDASAKMQELTAEAEALGEDKE